MEVFKATDDSDNAFIVELVERHIFLMLYENSIIRILCEIITCLIFNCDSVLKYGKRGFTLLEYKIWESFLFQLTNFIT